MRINYVLDCADTDRLADFWAAALGFERGGFEPPYVGLTRPGASKPEFLLQQVPSRSRRRIACTWTCASPTPISKPVDCLTG
jgi:hypothetical protein